MTSDDGPRVVIVGPCASGKSTLAANLIGAGIDARVSGQEHSEIATLWQRQQPDILIALRIDLETLRARRGPDWLSSIYDAQQRRLRHAYAAADLTLDTVRLSESDALSTALAFVRDVSSR